MTVNVESTFVGFLFGIAVSALVVLTSGGTVSEAIANYTRCMKDGGQKDHCIETYILKRGE